MTERDIPHTIDDDEVDPRQLVEEQDHLRVIERLLARHRRVENLVHRQDGPRQEVVESLVHKQNLEELRHKLASLPSESVARILEALSPDDSVIVWELLGKERAEEILDDLPEALHEDLDEEVVVPVDEDEDEGVRYTPPPEVTRRATEVHAFELSGGRLRQIEINTRAELAATQPIWVDILAPTSEERQWIAEIFGLKLPDADDLTDLEESARFFIAENGEVHLHSEFLLDKANDSRNVAVAFILHNGIVFSMRDEELPVFRLQRLRARIQPGYVEEGRDVLIDLYGANVEYSADALEDASADLESIGRNVLTPNVTDDEAAVILADIAQQEDLNGRIRRNVLDTRRALSFLMRARQLSAQQQNDARQILRDIDSLDGHTTYLFGKINFLMDATVGFVNINQNRRVAKLTTIGVVFTPLNIIAGMGGMSEFTTMTQGIPMPVAYGAFALVMILVGFGTYQAVRYFETRKSLTNKRRDA
jgi:magnesium transporter